MRKHLQNYDAIGAVQNAVRVALESIPLGQARERRCILAVSGGVDSLAMADAALAAADDLSLAPVIAHLNHGLRGIESDQDAEFVADFARRRACPCRIAVVDVGALARHMRASLEVAAREARYDFLADIAGSEGVSHIAVAHNADDQVETVLLRVIRGTGIAGLRGMASIAPHPGNPRLTVIRPLLGLPRQALEDYCLRRGLSPRTDSSNQSSHHLRNRVRHELLPMLETFNPGVRATILHLADSAGSDFELVREATASAYANVARSVGGAVAIDRRLWRGLSVGLQRETLREAVREVAGDLTHLRFDAIEEARAVLSSDAHTAEIALLATVRARVKGDVVVVTAAPRVS